MRRVFVAAVVCAAFLLLASPAFAGLARQAHPGVKAAPAPHVPRKTAPLLRSFAPLGALLATTVGVGGTVYDSSHSTLSGVEMYWWSWSEGEQRWYGDTMTSDAGGTYSASPPATDNGEIWAYPDGDTWWGRTAQSWTAGNSYSVDLYPGRVDVSATRGGPWSTFSGLAVDFWGDRAYSYDYQVTADSAMSPATVQVEALDGAYTSGSVNFWLDEGVEFSAPLTVTSGATPSGTISVSEVGAQRVQFPAAGFKYSGKPGATVRVDRINFPAGWRNSVSGYSDPTGKPSADHGVAVSGGGGSEPLSIKIPGTAKPGYSYWIAFQHVGADNYLPLYLETSYQVCTMKPSKTSITRSTRIRVSGVVPTEEHWGSRVGKRKAIVLWYHKGSAPVPTKWDPRKQGWTAVGGLKTTGTGSYTTPYFRVPRTGTLVVQYAGDNWYWGGFTSTAKVTVR